MQTLLYLILLISPMANAESDKGLRQTELELLEKYKIKHDKEQFYKEQQKKTIDPYTKLKQEVLCQELLTKIDKLSLESSQLIDSSEYSNTKKKTQKDKYGKVISEELIRDDEKNLNDYINARNKTNALKTQIKRYKTEALNICDTVYLKDSLYFSNKEIRSRRQSTK